MINRAKKLVSVFLCFLMVFGTLPNISGFHSISIAAGLPDGIQTFAGCVMVDGVGTSQDGYFQISASKSGLDADENGAFIIGDMTAETVYIQLEAISGLDNFNLTSVYVGELNDEAWQDVTIKGYLDGVEQFATTPYDNADTGESPTSNFPIDYSPANGIAIDMFRIYYTKPGSPTHDWDFNFLNFTIGQASADPPVSTYSITYNGNGNTGGSAPSDSTEYSESDEAIILGNTGSLSKTGYTFNNWNTAANGSGTAYAGGAAYTIATSDVTLYAQWTINQYTVSYTSNGGSSVSSESLDYNTAASEPSDPTKTGYTFEGWYTDEALTSAYNFSTAVTEDITLYAKWTINQYTVSYTSNGGSSVSSESLDYNAAASEPSNPTRTGYTFAGWYTDEALTITYNFSTVVTEDITLYAKWTINQYTVSYTSNGGSPVSSESLDYNTAASEPSDPTRTGYTFVGWYTDEALTSAYNFSTAVTEDITLYAKWTINQYTVSYTSNGGSSVSSESLDYKTAASEPSNPTRTGYTFAGWYTDEALTSAYNFSTAVTEDTTLYAKWTINQYTVSYTSNGGSSVSSESLDYNTAASEPSDPTKTGYTFVGWYTDEALTSAYNFSTAVTEDITLYAKWTINQYTVSYTSNGGSSVSSESLDYNTAASEPSNPTKTGYTFVGWNTDEALTSAYNFSTAVTENKTLYAKWTVNQYTVTFNTNEGTAVSGQTLDYGTLVEEPEDPTKSNYRLDGWYSDEGLTNEWDFGLDTLPASNMTLYAKWVLNQYTVEFNSNGGSVVSSQILTPGNYVSEPAAPEKTGYSFSGWYKENELQNEWSFEEDAIGSEDVDLYAGWTINSYEVAYDSNGGTSIETQIEDYGTLVTQPESPSRAGYEFAGWYSDSELINVWEFESDAVPATNVTLYAKWSMIIDTDLTGLTVQGYELKESFESSTLYYSVDDVIDAVVYVKASVDADMYASVMIDNEDADEEGWWPIDLENGSNLVIIKVTAQDEETVQTYTLTINRLSDVANLEYLIVDDLELEPAFDKGHTSYGIHVTSGSSINVSMAPEDNGAKVYYDSVEVTSGSAINLPISVGINTFEFNVIAKNGVDQNTYSLIVDKDNDDASPLSINVSDLILSPEYDKTQYNYEVVSITRDMDISVDIDEYSRIEINGKEVTSGEATKINLDVGWNEIIVRTTAEDGVSKKSYIINVYRKSDASELDNLIVEGHEFDEAFKPDITSYSLKVYAENEVELKVFKEDASSLTINGLNAESDVAHKFDLEVGENRFTIVSLAEDGVHESEYELVIVKANNISKLTDLAVKSNAMTPSFDSDTLAYGLKRQVGSFIEVTPYTDSSALASVSVNGVSTQSGNAVRVDLSLGANRIDVLVIAEDKVTQTKYSLYIERYQSEKRNEDDRSSEDQNQTDTTENESQDKTEEHGAVVVVNGKSEVAGTEKVIESEGKKTVEIEMNRTVIDEKIKAALEREDTIENKVMVKVEETQADGVSAKLTGDIVKKMEDNDFKLSVATGDVEYVIPAKEVRIEAIAELLEVAKTELEDIEVNVEIEKVALAVSEKILENAKTQSLEVVFPPVEFKVKAKARTLDGSVKEIEVTNFSEYVERVIEVPEDVDAEKITTGVLYNEDGTFSHIPTQIFEIEGKYFAKLNSMTNSSYSVIWNPVKVESVAGHWSEGTVNNLASRLVIDQIEAFDPEKPITRCEFINYVVKGMGLFKTGIGNEAVFTDISQRDSDVAALALQYGIVSGYPDGTLRPDSSITREEAMVIISNTLKLVDVDKNGGRSIVTFNDYDQISSWAIDAAEQISLMGIMVGVDENHIEPQGTFTCSQAAAAIENLLRAAGLIN